jgi:MFS family permease
MQQSEEQSFDKKKIILGLLALFLISGTMGFFIQAIGTARPKIAAALGGMSLFSWSVSIPGLISAFVSLMFGKFSDMYGRRIMLLISVCGTLIGATLCIFSTSFIFLIASLCVVSIGLGSSMPLSMAVLGDMFSPVDRSKWIGLMNIPMGIAAFFGPTLGGWLVENMGWNSVFISIIPLIVICLILVPIGIPPLANTGIKYKIDFLGCLLAILASSLTVIGISLGGTKYSWVSPEIISMLGFSLIFWILFFRAEHHAKEPILDPLLLRNRAFNTTTVATFLSCFGQIAMMMYFPTFLQGVLGVSSTISGMIITPFSVLMSFMGIPVGLLIARTKRYKLIYVLGFVILTIQLFGILFFTEKVSIIWCVLAAAVGGLGLGALPTINAIIIQNAVPKRLMGAAMGAFFFSLMMGVAISPALLGNAMNTQFHKTLKLPAAVERITDKGIIQSVHNPDVLLSKDKLAGLERALKNNGSQENDLFNQTIEMMRHSMTAGLRGVFLIGAITMLLALLLVLTLPETPVGSEVKAEAEALDISAPMNASKSSRAL